MEESGVEALQRETAMITIVNIGPFGPFADEPCNYEVRINRRLICRFRHKLSDGLVICLLWAAWGVYKAGRKGRK